MAKPDASKPALGNETPRSVAIAGNSPESMSSDVP
jgi:hypothetical protein